MPIKGLLCSLNLESTIETWWYQTLYKDILKCVEQFKLWTKCHMIWTFESMAWWQFITINDDNKTLSTHLCKCTWFMSWPTQQWAMCAWAQIHMKIPLNCAPPCHYYHVLSTLHYYHVLHLTPLPCAPTYTTTHESTNG
jgi:hypothetical protein